MRHGTVAVIGCGNVGAAAAFAMFIGQRGVSELLLVDKDRPRAEGHAMDLMHGQALVGRTAVRAAEMSELGSAQVVAITAGRNQRPGESRLDLISSNAGIVRTLIRELDAVAPHAVVIVATNPVDVLTHIALSTTTRPKSLVFGTGTTLDSARFRALIGAAVGVSPKHVHGYVFGEHGASQVPVWSTVTAGAERPALGDEERARIAAETRDAAASIIAKKGYTDLAIGTVIAHLVGAVLSDERGVHPLSVEMAGEYGIAPGVCVSVPCVLGRAGIVRRVTPALTAEEEVAVRCSAEFVRAAIPPPPAE